MPRSITPAVPRKSCQCDFLVLASGTLKPSPTASVASYGAESLEGGTSPLRPAMFPVYASPVLFVVTRLRHRRNTRYGLLARLCPIESSTLQEAPSCARRTNVDHQGF